MLARNRAALRLRVAGRGSEGKQEAGQRQRDFRYAIHDVLHGATSSLLRRPLTT